MKMELKLLHKRKSKANSKLDSKQKVALHALQKQMQVLELKEWLFVVGFAGAASLLRVPMQAIPNVEPLTFFALLAGWLFGWKKGIVAGVSSLYISNFLVFGGQGLWTIFQVAGYGLVGFFGSLLRKKSTLLEVLGITFIATISLQLIFNLGWSILIGFNVFAAILTGLIFTVVHVISNLIFAVFLPKVRKVIYEKGKFDEKELCSNLIAELNSRMRRKQGN
jgi:energy-coupling factor transport system substrate-specific component